MLDSQRELGHCTSWHMTLTRGHMHNHLCSGNYTHIYQKKNFVACIATGNEKVSGEPRIIEKQGFEVVSQAFWEGSSKYLCPMVEVISLAAHCYRLQLALPYVPCTFLCAHSSFLLTGNPPLLKFKSKLWATKVSRLSGESGKCLLTSPWCELHCSL